MKLPLQFLFWWAGARANVYTIVGAGGGVSGGTATFEFVQQTQGGEEERRHRRRKVVAARPRRTIQHVEAVARPTRSGGVAAFSQTRLVAADGGLTAVGSADVSKVRSVSALGGLTAAGIADVSKVRALQASGGLHAYGTADIHTVDFFDLLLDEDDDWLLSEVA